MNKRFHVFIPWVVVPLLFVNFTAHTSAQVVFGYSGKPYDQISGLYDFGYRDYDPQTGRFITEDPIRDGVNWYSFVNQDPVNFKDPSGLICIPVISRVVMSVGDWADMKLNGSDELIRNSGCAVTYASNMLYAMDIRQNPNEINEKYVSEGSLSWQEVADANGMSVDRKYGSYTAADYKKQEADAKNMYYTGIQVPYKDGEGSHWVGVEGVTEKDGVVYFEASATSKFDTASGLNSGRENSGWVKDGDKVLIPESVVKGAVVFKKEKNL